ncbi:FAD binding domain-containing protein [Chloroflexota bacterium]
MVMDCEYLKPKALEEALALISQYKEESKIIAGGQSLLVLIQEGLVKPNYLIDIKGVSALDYINFDKNEGLRIGSLTTHRAIETSPVIRNGFGVLCEMEEEVATIQIRNRGTIGGNICHADPAGDPCPVLIALNAKVKMASLSGERTMSLEEFNKDYFESALQDDDILTEVQVPITPPHTGSSYAKFRIAERDSTLVATAALITLNAKNEACDNARIVLGGAAPIPLRVEKAEKLLLGAEVTDDLLEEVAQIASEESSPIPDMSGSEEYKRELVRILVKRVAKEALRLARC